MKAKFWKKDWTLRFEHWKSPKNFSSTTPHFPTRCAENSLFSITFSLFQVSPEEETQTLSSGYQTRTSGPKRASCFSSFLEEPFHNLCPCPTLVHWPSCRPTADRWELGASSAPRTDPPSRSSPGPAHRTASCRPQSFQSTPSSWTAASPASSNATSGLFQAEERYRICKKSRTCVQNPLNPPFGKAQGCHSTWLTKFSLSDVKKRCCFRSVSEPCHQVCSRSEGRDDLTVNTRTWQGRRHRWERFRSSSCRHSCRSRPPARPRPGSSWWCLEPRSEPGSRAPGRTWQPAAMKQKFESLLRPFTPTSFDLPWKIKTRQGPCHLSRMTCCAWWTDCRNLRHRFTFFFVQVWWWWFLLANRKQSAPWVEVFQVITSWKMCGWFQCAKEVAVGRRVQ